MGKLVLPNYVIEHKQEYNYAIDTLGIRKMWSKSITGKNINIAIIDSGCDTEHQDLKENIIDVYNFTSDDNQNIRNVTDYLGHGTHVAGIIANQNKNYLIGIAPNAKLLILKVLNNKGIGNTNTLIKAIKYAIEWRGKDGSKVDIINMSLGTTKDRSELREAVDEAIANNIILVAAAGNDGDGLFNTDEINYPGYYKEVFQIGSTDIDNIPTGFTNSNSNIDFVAPGKDIFSTFPNNKYATLSGTSMSSPQVTGVIALIKNLYRRQGLEITNITIEDYLRQRAQYLIGFSSNIQGYGLVKI